MSEKSDEALYLEMQRSKDPEIFKALYDRHSGPLFRFIYRFTLNRQITEDLLQEIFTQFFSGKYQYDEGGSLKSWLYTVAKNKSLNHLKKMSFEVSGLKNLDSFRSDQNIEESLIEKNLISALQLAEGQLPTEMKETWKLRKAGLDYKQISNELSIPVGTVKSRFHRLVEILKKEIEK